MDFVAYRKKVIDISWPGCGLEQGTTAIFVRVSNIGSVILLKIAYMPF